MDTLIAGHQAYGGSVSESQDLLAKLAPVLQGANMGWQEGTELINLFNAAGVDASAGITGLTKALGAVESPDELQALLVDIASTVDPFERAQKAIDAFGAKAGPKLAQALQASGGDLSRFGFELEDIAGKTEEAAAVLDDTLTSKLRLAVNHGLSLLRGFGMSVGPVLTGAVSAISFGKTLGLDRALSPLFRGAGRTAAGAFRSGLSLAMGAADRLFGPLVSKLGSAASSLGSMAGGKFGMAFKAAAAVGPGACSSPRSWRSSARSARRTSRPRPRSTSRCAALLAEAPTRAEAEAKLAALKAIPESLDGVASAVYGFADLAKGNILGSAVDGLFGANPAQVNEQQIAALEAYLAQLPADTAPVAEAAGAEVIATVADGVEQGAGAVRQAGNAIGSEAAQGVRDGIAQSAGKVAGAWDAVASALAKGPKIMSRAARLKDFGKAVDHATRMLRRSIVANDPLAVVVLGERARQGQRGAGRVPGHDDQDDGRGQGRPRRGGRHEGRALREDGQGRQARRREAARPGSPSRWTPRHDGRSEPPSARRPRSPRPSMRR